MRNVNVVVKPDETPNDIIAQICLSENIKPDDLFAFSAILTPMQDGCSKLKINCIEKPDDNPYTPVSLIHTVYRDKAKENGIRYAVPPLEQYITVFRPMLYKMVSKAYPYYQKLIPDREDMLSILFLTVCKLHKQDYYLHNQLIYKSFIAALNMEVRKTKNFDNKIQSLDQVIGTSDDGNDITLGETISHQQATEDAYANIHYTLDDYWSDMFETIKAAMLQDMSQLAFDRILIQLKSKTIDSATSRILSKYREMFNPDFIPRPNARGKNKKGR